MKIKTKITIILVVIFAFIFYSIFMVIIYFKDLNYYIDEYTQIQKIQEDISSLKTITYDNIVNNEERSRKSRDIRFNSIKEKLKEIKIHDDYEYNIYSTLKMNLNSTMELFKLFESNFKSYNENPDENKDFYINTEKRIKTEIFITLEEVSSGGLLLSENTMNMITDKRKFSYYIYLFILCFFGIVTILFISFLGKSILDSIKKFKEGIDVIEEGNLEYEIKIKGKDEIYEFSKKFNNLTKRLSELLKMLENKNNALKILLEEKEKWGNDILNVNTNLEKRVEERTTQLTKAKLLAEEANIAKSQFIANMSHEIRTPINAIIGFNYLINKMNVDDKTKNYTEKTLQSAKILLGLINNILDFSKIEANKIEVEEVEFNLFDLIANIANTVSLQLYENKNTLVFEIDQQIEQDLIGDPNKVSQIILNIINNAIKFTKNGNIIFKIELINSNINSEISNLKFSIEDTGIGIDKTKQEQIFNPFAQADMSTTRNYGGTGLGLTITKNLIKLMNGSISLESEIGVGSKFIFNLVLKNSKINFESSRSLSFRICLISCNNMMLESMFSQISKMNFDVEKIFVKKGDMFELNIHFDLIIIDIECISMYMSMLIDSQTEYNEKVLFISNKRNNEIKKLEEGKLNKKLAYFPLSNNLIIKKFNDILRNETKFEFSKINLEYEEEIYFKDKEVLIVEDNIINQEVIKNILEDYNMIIDTAQNGEIAVDMTDVKKYDLIIMDLQMPVMDGFKSSEEIRKGEVNRDTPIVAMTADAFVDVKIKALEVGLNDFLVKPIDPNEMNRVMLKWLKKKSINK